MSVPAIFQLDFMIRAFIAGGIIGVTAPVLGVFLVLRRLSLMADTLAHVAIAGATLGVFLGAYPLPIAIAASATAAVVLERLRVSRGMAGDSAMALILYSALALALVLISSSGGTNASFLGFLFGNIVTVAPSDVIATAISGAGLMLLVWLRYGDLVQSTFDPDLARVSGVPVERINLVLALLTGVTVTLSMRVLGALLVGALIVVPVLASLSLRCGFRTTLLAAAAIGLASVLIGLTLAYYQDVAASGAIVLTALCFLGITAGANALRSRRAAVRV